jgi:hypothetical protein
VVVISVCDAGIGFRRSLESNTTRPRSDRLGRRHGARGGGAAQREPLPRPGRGQGLAGIRRYVTKWNGKLAVRSGTARIALVPDWDDDVALREGLAEFPGAQVQITIPGAVPAAARPAAARPAAQAAPRRPARRAEPAPGFDL